eukprot:CAMPEP_0119131582 /NCGR_PEP_ID=MMETSP1310-20130426/10467_1 /TAXON_ID=464262 /ORGANISM="Genus nov. species nov., Strain RCC2339" /LENGTH=122 /DNA_ID=CAMNT_0007122165 /DNA_START=269 /DNA_END=637 /DNA_ORIENTATION=-
MDGLHLVKRRIKATPERKGSIVTKAMSIHHSNVALLDPADGKPCRVGWSFIDGERVRVSKRSGAVVERPKLPTRKDIEDGEKDTPPDITSKKTFDIGDITAGMKDLRVSLMGKEVNQEPKGE